MKAPALMVSMLVAVFLVACAQSNDEMQSGYYVAEAASYDLEGWKEFVSIYVDNSTIMTVEFDAKNESGFIKSWDMEYMQKMRALKGTYPTQYMRAYGISLISKQNPEAVDAVSGATQSYHSFCQLSKAAMAQAKAGDKKPAIVDLSLEE